MRRSKYTFLQPKNYLYNEFKKRLQHFKLGYRFGNNGKENDDETQTQDSGFRIYSGRLGRFISNDSLTKSDHFSSPNQSSVNIPQAIDKDQAEPEYMVSAQGKLTTPILILFNALNSVQITTMMAINIIKGGAKLGHNAETWNETTIITTSEKRSDAERISTLFHEVKHAEEFKKSILPAFLLRLSHSFQDFFSHSVIPEWHKDAYNAGTFMDKFIESNQNILDRIKNKTISYKEIKIAAYSFNIKQLDYQIDGLGFQINKATNNKDGVAAEKLQKKIDYLNKQKAEQTNKREETNDEI